MLIRSATIAILLFADSAKKTVLFRTAALKTTSGEYHPKSKRS